MRAIIIISIVSIFSFSSIAAQGYRLGIAMDYVIMPDPGHSEWASPGLSILLEYRLPRSLFAVTANTAWNVIPSYRDKYVGGDGSIFSMGTYLKYYPFSTAIKPYLGIGIMYNKTKLNQSGNASFTSDGKTIGHRNIEYNFSYHVKLGFLFFSERSINIFIESSYRLSKSNAVVVLSKYPNIKEVFDRAVDFSAYVISGGFMVKL